MLGSVEIIEMVAETIEKHNFKNVVVDPVMVCKGADEDYTLKRTIAYVTFLCQRH